MRRVVSMPFDAISGMVRAGTLLTDCPKSFAGTRRGEPAVVTVPQVSAGDLILREFVLNNAVQYRGMRRQTLHVP